MLPDLRGRRVVDLGCGFGWFCRWAREQGAAHVLGLDVSEKCWRVPARLRPMRRSSMSAPSSNCSICRRQSFDLAYSSLALHYVKDLAAPLAAVHRALIRGGHLVFSIEHPIYMAPSHPAWSADADGRRIWPLNRYLVEGERVTDWFANGVVKYHRTIGTTLTLLIRLGFAITHVEEWCPTDAQIAAKPELAQERERPMFLLVAAQR